MARQGSRELHRPRSDVQADVSAHKAAIKSVIEAHLDNLKAEPAPRSEVWKRPYDGDAAEEEEAAHPAAKVARVAGSAGPRSASAAGAGPRTVEGEVDGIVLSEPGATNVRKAAVREWKGHHSVDVRGFYVDKSTGAWVRPERFSIASFFICLSS